MCLGLQSPGWCHSAATLLLEMAKKWALGARKWAQKGPKQPEMGPNAPQKTPKPRTEVPLRKATLLPCVWVPKVSARRRSAATLLPKRAKNGPLEAEMGQNGSKAKGHKAKMGAKMAEYTLIDVLALSRAWPNWPGLPSPTCW